MASGALFALSLLVAGVAAGADAVASPVGAGNATRAMPTLFDIRRNAARWSGADCASSFPLERADGTVASVFLFGDTLVCDVGGDPPRRQSANLSFPHSTAGVIALHGGDATPNASDVSFAVAKNATGSVVSLFRPISGEDVDGHVFWWVTQGLAARNKSAPRASAVLLATRVQLTSGKGPFGFQVLGTSLLSVPDTESAPQRWDYAHTVLAFSSGCLTWTTALFRDPRRPAYAMVMGQNACGPLNGTKPVVLARMPIAAVGAPPAEAAAHWEFLLRDGGGATTWGVPPTGAGAADWLARRLHSLFPGAPPETSVVYVEQAGAFLCPYVDGFGPHIYVRASSDVEHGWPEHGRLVYSVPPPLGGSSAFYVYAPKLHPEVPCTDADGRPGLTLTFASNAFHLGSLFEATAAALEAYVPQFVCLDVSSLGPHSGERAELGRERAPYVASASRLHNRGARLEKEWRLTQRRPHPP